jgi:hypothetical protein
MVQNHRTNNISPTKHTQKSWTSNYQHVMQVDEGAASGENGCWDVECGSGYAETFWGWAIHLGIAMAT